MPSPLWFSKWISPAYDPRQDLGIFAFRNRLTLDEVPSELIVQLSADNRYKLFVNGRMVMFGPQRGDANHWFYDSVDLAPFLVPGENVILALVWNFGWMAPMAQHTVRTAFVFDVPGSEGATQWDEPVETEEFGPLKSERQPESDSPFPELCTPGGWLVARVEGWGFEMMHSGVGEFYIDIGPGEILDTTRIPPGLTAGQDGELDWKPPHIVSAAEERGANGGGTPWMLVPRSVPPMRYQKRSTPPTVRHDWPPSGADEALGQSSLPLTIEPGVGRLLDYQELLCAYPRLELAATEGVATVALTYAESLWSADGQKGNRDEVAGKQMHGYQDRVTVGEDGGTFEPLWWRTYRYVLIESDRPVILCAVEAYETGYPLNVESSFQADDPHVAKIWDVSVRTAARCAGETYFDCPYYEQLQYAGDTRIQALIGYYLGRDRALPRNAVETLGWSRMENGLTQSRYPSRQPQVIPPFSLWWVLMRQDQRLYDRLPESEEPGDDPIDTIGLDVANAFNRLSDADLDRTFWNFGDWAPEWKWGVPPGGARSTMHMLTLYLAHLASEMSLDEDTPHGRQRADALALYILGQFETVGGLVRHQRDPETKLFSEHSEALYRAIQRRLRLPISPWPAAALEDAKAARCTFYFAYYKHLAKLAEPAWNADYMAELEPWKEMIESGLTTFAENPEPTRSDCHAWSAHPILGFLQLVAGVTSAAPGWRKVRIAPNPGGLRRFDARIAHPGGELKVAFRDGRLTVDTPVPAVLIWHGKKVLLTSGEHQI